MCAYDVAENLLDVTPCTCIHVHVVINRGKCFNKNEKWAEPSKWSELSRFEKWAKPSHKYEI